MQPARPGCHICRILLKLSSIRHQRVGSVFLALGGCFYVFLPLSRVTSIKITTYHYQIKILREALGFTAPLPRSSPLIPNLCQLNVKRGQNKGAVQTVVYSIQIKPDRFRKHRLMVV